MEEVQYHHFCHLLVRGMNQDKNKVFSELYEDSKQTANPWAFEPECPMKKQNIFGRAVNTLSGHPVLIGSLISVN